MTDLELFAEAVGSEGPVTVSGSGTRGGPVPGVRAVRAPAGVLDVQPAEMTVRCGAATPVDELVAVLAPHGQTVALPDGGTVGGALAVGHSDVRRLGWGPVRDTLLEARVVGAHGRVIRIGGPTVKNVSGFDLCRLMVGASGVLGFFGEVLLRTRPLAAASRWYTRSGVDSEQLAELQRRIHRPVSVLWDGVGVWVLLEGHPADLAATAAEHHLSPVDGPPELPRGSRRSMPPAAAVDVAARHRPRTDDAVPALLVEVGVGIVHHREPADAPTPSPRVQALTSAVLRAFDPRGRLNPGIADQWCAGAAMS